MFVETNLIQKQKCCNFKILKFSKMKYFSFQNRNFPRKHWKWPLHKSFESDGNRNDIITWCSYSAKIKIQYGKITFHVAHFQINEVLSTRNMLKEDHVIKSRGALGTGFTYAPELCFKPAVNRQPGFRRWYS